MSAAQHSLFEPRPDAHFENLAFWRIEYGDERKGEALFQALDRVRAARLPGYESDFEGPSYENDMPWEPNQVTLVFGNRFTELQGVIKLTELGNSSDVGSISQLVDLDNGRLKDLDGTIVTRAALKNYDGYNLYKGTGDVIHLDIMQTLFRGRGIGSSAIRFLQSNSRYELIELEANDYNAARFFERNGFIDTGIDPENGRQLSLVWHRSML
jgi:ribosomal protein S18 acetylase RimI-like enzyme